MRELDADVALARDLLHRRGLAREVLSAVAAGSGGNNRVVLLQTDQGPCVAKLYFADAADGRDRLHSEFAFLEYAAGVGLSCVPAPMAADTERRLAIYSHVEGTRLAAGMLADAHVQQALAFFRALNGAFRPRAAALPPASEACFSLAEHIRLVDGRLERLQQLAGEDALAREGAALAAAISSSWNRVRTEIVRRAGPLAWDVDSPLPADERCVSPSDFGFHNALVRPSGEVVFLDFEYAGWDDPAKAIDDFFCQTQVPVDMRWFPEVASGFSAHAPSPAAVVRRARVLFPLFWLKWCLIRLNAFVPHGLRRRLFARPGQDVEALKRERLEEARAALKRLPEVTAFVDAVTGDA